MRNTYVKAVLDLTDIGALKDASITASSKQPFSDLDLMREETKAPAYASDELNSFVLDGSRILANSKDNVCWMSTQKSDSEAKFEAGIGLEINFNVNHTSIGITLVFGQNTPHKIRVSWYGQDASNLVTKEYYPDAPIYFCRQQVDGYRRVVVEFLESNMPGEFATLQFLRYGALLEWSKSKVKSAKLLEEIDLTSATLSINTATVSVLDEDGEFDIKNEDGAWKSIQKTQRLILTEYNGVKEINAGTFYVNEQTYASNIATFSCVDGIGIIDNYTFYDGKIYTGETAGEIIAAIMAAAGWTDYTIDASIADIPLYGWIGVQTCREALQMVCFATGAIADDSRATTIRIYKPDRYVSNEVGVERKFQGGTSVELDSYVSGVLIEYPRYSIAEKSSRIYDDELAKGVSRITFKSPYAPETITATAGRIVTRATNYIDIELDEATSVTISGTKYEAEEYAYQKSVDEVAPGETESVKELSGCTLYNATLLPSIADKLLNYYALRKTVDMRYIMSSESAGQWINIRDAKKNRATSVIESLSIDLAGGFIANASCRGYSKVTTDYVYTGHEIYAGEEWVE